METLNPQKNRESEITSGTTKKIKQFHKETSSSFSLSHNNDYDIHGRPIKDDEKGDNGLTGTIHARYERNNIVISGELDMFTNKKSGTRVDKGAIQIGKKETGSFGEGTTSEYGVGIHKLGNLGGSELQEFSHRIVGAEKESKILKYVPDEEELGVGMYLKISGTTDLGNYGKKVALIKKEFSGKLTTLGEIKATGFIGISINDSHHTISIGPELQYWDPGNNDMFKEIFPDRFSSHIRYSIGSHKHKKGFGYEFGGTLHGSQLGQEEPTSYFQINYKF